MVATADTGRSTVDPAVVVVLGLLDLLDLSEPPRLDARRNGRDPNVRRRLFAERAAQQSKLAKPVRGKRTDQPPPLIVDLVADLVAAPGAPQPTPATCGNGSF